MESSVSEFIVLLLAVAVVIAALLLFNYYRKQRKINEMIDPKHDHCRRRSVRSRRGGGNFEVPKKNRKNDPGVTQNRYEP